MKKHKKAFALVLAGFMALTLVVSPLTVPRIPPLWERAAVEIEHNVA